MKQYITKLSILAIGFLLATVTSYLSAWTGAPAGTPPANNTPAPINVGDSDQVKIGNIQANALSALLVASNEFCLNGDCIKSWPTGAGGELVLHVTNSNVNTSPGGIKVNFTNEVVDTLNSFDLNSDEVRLPAGTYSFEISASGCGFLSNNGTGQDQFNIKLNKNGADFFESPTLVSNNGLNCLTPQKTGTVVVGAGDVIYMKAWHD